MRLWSIHPRYLDTKGLIALWRESLLARKVLQKQTKGYTRHPQLIRFRNCAAPLDAINEYLKIVWEESRKRNFSFNEGKLDPFKKAEKIPVTRGQVEYEFTHLLHKLMTRDPSAYLLMKNLKKIEPHPLFKIIPGKIEVWEKRKNF